MRGLIITLILFATLTAIMIFNFYFVDSLISNMENEVHSLSCTPSAENTPIFEKLKKDWEKKSIWLSLSVAYDDIEKVTDLIDSLNAANETQNFVQFQIHIELLLNALEEMGRLEKFSLKNIL